MIEIPLQIRLLADVDILPAGINVTLPYEHSLALIRRQYASPIADLNASPDFVMDDDQIAYVRLPWMRKELAINA